MYADAELARRIEGAEARLTRAVGEHIARRRPGQTLVAVIGEGVGVATPEGSPFDKVIGIGLGGFDLDAFLAFESAVLARGGRVQVELCTRADPAVARALTERGYVLVGFEDVLGLRLDAGCIAALEAAPVPGVEITRVAGDDAAWMNAVVDGFLTPDGSEIAPPHETFARQQLVQVFDDMASAPGLVRFLARRGYAVAGGASLRLDGGIAQLSGAATLSAHRRQGVHAALLRARLLHAVRAGCDVAVITTQPGSASQANAIRRGFGILYTRAVLVRSP